MADLPAERDKQIDALLEVVSRQARSQEGLTALVHSLDGLKANQDILEARQKVSDEATAAIVPRAEMQQRWSRDNLLLTLVVLAVLAVAGLAVHYASNSAASLKVIQTQRLAALTVAESSCLHTNAILQTLTGLTSAVSQDSNSEALRNQAFELKKQVPSLTDCSVFSKQIAVLQEETK